MTRYVSRYLLVFTDIPFHQYLSFVYVSSSKSAPLLTLLTIQVNPNKTKDITNVLNGLMSYGRVQTQGIPRLT